MNASSADVITSPELRTLLESPTAPRVIDVRTPAEFETSHIAGSYNVPFDVVDEHGPAVAQRLDDDADVVQTVTETT
ncbi:MAG: rhodanese-like domain-containing protein [Actinomycetota bacterium]|uniref:Rhodanese-like domain-containing protein n=1 Tax=Mycobacterium lentiflavum TaxID=141349 RepID=A0ABY3UUP4_MYCLN|nr:rhodanese-like domain-containing protein [Mycobacterium lentiflavum]MEE3063853.1 rhodanese-like domain-containing protein [Actinomycetota bacterium]ULP40856.1 rhodanese-like domain-containing protein [Mycobacterium lentiflavum]